MKALFQALARHAWLPTCGVVASLLLLGPARAADPLVVKLATLAPEGSAWYNSLRKMGDDWNQISGGLVTLKIYAGGVSGNEGAAVRKMRIGQLHAASLTSLGLLDIDAASQVMNTPMLIQSYSELDYVMAKMTPAFETRLESKGFVALNWGEAGWAYMFTKTPITDPSQAADVKIYAWEGDNNAVAAFRQAGFNPVVIASVDMVPSLQSGLVEGFHSTPLAALSLQWFALAPNMLNVPWAPLVGGTVMTTSMWEQIPGEYRSAFIMSAHKYGEELKVDVRNQDRKAITVMQKYGLNVVNVDSATTARWQTLAESIYPTIRSTVVPSDIYDQTMAAVNEYRASH